MLYLMMPTYFFSKEAFDLIMVLKLGKSEHLDTIWDFYQSTLGRLIPPYRTLLDSTHHYFGFISMGGECVGAVSALNIPLMIAKSLSN